jgi:KaiC/GvpD/RAD55 family RecA-like ATPase
MSEKTLDELEEENLIAEQELSIEQKRAAIKEAKAKYGSDYKRVIGDVVSGLKGSIHEPPSMMRGK